METKKVKGIGLELDQSLFLLTGGLAVNNKLKLYIVNPDYCDYLRQFDYRVPINNKDKDRRPFVGIVLEVGVIKYYVALTSPKEKHLSMSNSQDFIKINDGIWGAINLNNMIPISEKELTLVDLTINQDDDAETIQYKNLLENQRKWCNKEVNMIRTKAAKLHSIITSGKSKNTSLVARCCNFKLLEKKYIEYCESNQSTTSLP